MTFDSKMLKGSNKWLDEPITRWERLRCWYWDTTFYKFYSDVSWKFFWKPLRDIKKMWDWYWKVFNYEYDFDACYIYKILAYKLRRIEHALVNGNAVHDPKDLKALKLAIKLADRLFEDQIYFDRPYSRHEKKWGELITWFEPCNDGTGCSYWRSRRPKANTPEEIEQEHKEFMKAGEEEEFLRKRDQKWFYGILTKYQRSWWD